MPLPIYRLRRWLAVIAVLFTATVAGMYFYARLRQRNVLREIPNKIGIDIKQTANGFQFSKSDGKRTLFTVQAGSLKQFQVDGSAELHKVSIILYGRDSTRFDQIYGDDFSYDKKSGNVTAHGDVQIDLEPNPGGLTGPDQGTPKELKNPIHLETHDLVFNQNTGDASTNARVDFRTPQATGWAVGVQYSGKTNVLTLESQIHVTLGEQSSGHIDGHSLRHSAEQRPATLVATHGIISRDPHEVVLDHPRLEREHGTMQAEQATFFLGPDNEVQRLLATGNVTAESTGESADQMRARADAAELWLEGKQNLLRTATLTGNVHVERSGSQAMQGDAGRAVLDFLGQNQLQKVHAIDGVRLAQHSGSSSGTSSSSLAADTTNPPALDPALESEFNPEPAPLPSSRPQDYDLTAPVVDFFVTDGRRLDHAETSGAAKIVISPSATQGPGSGAVPSTRQSATQQSVITAGRFYAKFAATPKGTSRLTSLHGAPDAKIVNLTPGLPDRISTSQTLDAAFLPQGGIASILQQGSVAYTDGQVVTKRTQAWADKALYTPADEILVLTGSPRVSQGPMVTTARTIRINRATDDAFADNDVKSTYSDLQEQPNGALLASASPIHVTAATMTAHNSPAVALYRGNARLWQDANIVEAPSIQFDRTLRFLVAQGTAAQPVSTVLVQAKLAQAKLAQTKLAQPSLIQQNNLPQAQLSPGKTLAGEEDKAKIKSGEKSARKSDEDSPVAITSARLTYADQDRLAHYEGGVVAKGANFTASSNTMDAYLRPRSQTSNNQALASSGQLDHLVAKGNVVVLQPTRRAVGTNLVYTSADDRFVLTGGPPSIFDAERGKVTGVSLTFFRADDRVLVEGEASTPVVTQTRVAK